MFNFKVFLAELIGHLHLSLLVRPPLYMARLCWEWRWRTALRSWSLFMRLDISQAHM